MLSLSDAMTAFLPPNLLALFAPRDPIPYLPPAEKLPFEKKVTHNYTGSDNIKQRLEVVVDVLCFRTGS